MCDTLFCNVSRDDCAISHLEKTNTIYLCDTLATSITRCESIAAGPLRVQVINFCPFCEECGEVERRRDDNKNKICVLEGGFGVGAERKIVQKCCVSLGNAMTIKNLGKYKFYCQNYCCDCADSTEVFGDKFKPSFLGRINRKNSKFIRMRFVVLSQQLLRDMKSIAAGPL